MHYHLQLQKKAQQFELADTGRSAYAKRTTDKTMEKLLSATKKQGGNYAADITANAQKIFSLAIGATKIFFCQHTSNNF